MSLSNSIPFLSMEVQLPSPPTTTTTTTTTTTHVVVVPYPSRGHINPMMNLSKLLVSNNTNMHVTFIVTEQWLPSIASEPKPSNITLASLPNLAASTDSFNDVVDTFMTEMEAPFEKLLHALPSPPNFVICDAFLSWAVAVGNRRNVPVAAFWSTNTSELWLQYFHIFQQNQQHLHANMFDYIPSISWIHRADIPLLDGNNRQILQWVLKSCEWLSKAQYLLLSSIYELEPQVIDAIKARLSVPIYTIGPNIPYFSVGDNSCYTNNGASNGYLDWLDLQPKGSVLYISYGSYLSISRTQMDEIANALHDSNVRFMWVTRGESSKLNEICGHMGLVVAWCDQLRVLLHPAVGGYWTHCGWNSVMEGVFAGVPFLTFPLAMDQPLISKLIVEDWKVGWRVKKDDKLDTLVRKDEIVVLLREFMELDSDVVRDMRKRAKELQHMAQLAITKNGSSGTNIKAFAKNIIYTGSNRGQVQNGIENLN